MPIHDWTRVEAGDFHHFHQCWVVAIGNALNGGLLPPGYIAMAEQITGRPIPDVVTLKAREPKAGPEGGIAVAVAPPTARVIARMDRTNWPDRTRRGCATRRRSHMSVLARGSAATSGRNRCRLRAPESGRVTQGGCPPRVPTDPDLPN
jgi:hypothetical protein